MWKPPAPFSREAVSAAIDGASPGLDLPIGGRHTLARMCEHPDMQVQADAAELGRRILDAIELAVAQDRWDVADRLLMALEELADESGHVDSLTAAYGTIVQMLGSEVDAERAH